MDVLQHSSVIVQIWHSVLVKGNPAICSTALLHTLHAKLQNVGQIIFERPANLTNRPVPKLNYREPIILWKRTFSKLCGAFQKDELCLASLKL